MRDSTSNQGIHLIPVNLDLNLAIMRLKWPNVLLEEAVLFFLHIVRKITPLNVLPIHVERSMKFLSFLVDSRQLFTNVLDPELLISQTPRLDDRPRKNLIRHQELLQHALMHIAQLVFLNLAFCLHLFWHNQRLDQKFVCKPLAQGEALDQ